MSHILQDLDGINSARLHTSADPQHTTLTLSAPSGFIDGHFYPAESFTLSGDALVGLALLLRQCLPEEE